MIIHEIHDLSNSIVVRLLESEFCKITNTNIIQNYHPEYRGKPGNVFTLLDTDGRYKQGQGKYYVIEQDGQYVCSAGWNIYQLQTDVALLLTRMYVAPQHRSQYAVGKYILPLAISEALHTADKLWMTFNEHNHKWTRWFDQNKHTFDMQYSSFQYLDVMQIYGVRQYVYQYCLQ